MGRALVANLCGLREQGLERLRARSSSSHHSHVTPRLEQRPRERASCRHSRHVELAPQRPTPPRMPERASGRRRAPTASAGPRASGLGGGLPWLPASRDAPAAGRGFREWQSASAVRSAPAASRSPAARALPPRAVVVIAADPSEADERTRAPGTRPESPRRTSSSSSRAPPAVAALERGPRGLGSAAARSPPADVERELHRSLEQIGRRGGAPRAARSPRTPARRRPPRRARRRKGEVESPFLRLARRSLAAAR